jgi:hypothetical protein
MKLSPFTASLRRQLFLIAAILAAASTNAQDISTGLVARWQFHGNLADSSGNGLNLNPGGTFAYVADHLGVAANAVQLITAAPSTGTFFYGNGPSLANLSSSVAFWVRKDYVGNLSNGSWVFGLGSNSAEGARMHVALDYGQSIRYAFFYRELDLFTPILNPSQWYHLACTYNRSTGLRCIYVNGVLVGSTSVSDAFTGDTALTIGFPLISLSDFRFYNRALSAADVAALAVYQLTIGPALTSLSDLFIGNQVDASKWATAVPFGDSSVTESGGYLTLTNRGRLLTQGSFTNAVDISLKFAFAGSAHDVLQVSTRNNGAVTNGSFTSGIVFQVQMQTDTGSAANNIIISGPQGVLATATFPIQLGQTYALRMVDDSANLSFYVNNLVTPIVTATNTTTIGNQIGIQNREGAAAGSSISAGSQVKLDSITVNAPAAATTTVLVPDVGAHLINLSTLGTNGLSMGFTVGGTGTKTVLVRGVGPTLKALGVTGAATQTALTLFSGATAIGSNSGWSAALNASQISAAFVSTGAFVLPTGSADSAMLVALTPGTYSAQVSGNGTILVEAYDVP